MRLLFYVCRLAEVSFLVITIYLYMLFTGFCSILQILVSRKRYSSEWITR